ncbi:uroporphyrinogen decarboxylase family protein [Verrucomicrobiota bacterium]
MTGRERMSALLNKKATDRLAWTTLVDNASLDAFPRGLRGNWGIDFYRHLDCDLFFLNGWNTPHRFRSPQLCWGIDVREEHTTQGSVHTATWHTPQGRLARILDRGHPRKYPVDSIDAVRIYRAMWESARFEAHDDAPVLAELDLLLGETGVVTRFCGPSTIPRLLEVDMGTENFYYLFADYPEEMHGLIRTMHAGQLDAFRILAAGPCTSVTLTENTSTHYISPDIYRRYNMPHQRDFVESIQANGKTAILHMCGHVRNLLDLIKETRCDGIHFLTPPPTGDTPWEEALDVLGEDLIIFGCLDPTIFAAGDVAGIGPALDALITPRLRGANFVLSPTADGITVELSRFLAVRDWIAKRGAW